MQLSDISQAPQIASLEPEFAAKGIPFQPSLENAYNEAVGRSAGVESREVIIRAVVAILNKLLEGKEGEKQPWWKRALKTVLCFFNAYNAVKGKVPDKSPTK
jgi:hypothetical protein